MARPIIEDLKGDVSMGRMKHGGPIPSCWGNERSDGLHRDNTHSTWSADGWPFARLHFRAKDDKDGFDIERNDPVKKIYQLIDDYKKAMIQQGRETEVLGRPEEAKTYEISDGLPPEAIETMRKAFEEKDTDAMAKAMLALNEYDPVHKSFDDRLHFWMKEFSKAWKPEFEKDEKASKQFVQDSLQPFMPLEFKDLSGDIERYEEKKQLALAAAKEKGKDSFAPAVDMTDSALSVLQSTSFSMDWETTAMMGMEPGMGFAAHCSSTLESGIYEGLYGDYGDQHHIDFAQRYPKSKGRQTLPDALVHLEGKGREAWLKDFMALATDTALQAQLHEEGMEEAALYRADADAVAKAA